MANEEIPEGLIRIRRKWPMAASDTAAWAKIVALASTDDEAKWKEANKIARDVVMNDPQLKARHAGYISSRNHRVKFLKDMAEREKAMRLAFAKEAKLIASKLHAAASDDGTISPGKYESVMIEIRDINRKTYGQVNKIFMGMIRSSIRIGLRRAQAMAQAVIDSAKGLKEADAVPDPLKQQMVMSKTVFDRLFKGALKDTMRRGMFGSTGVSSRVWDMRDVARGQLQRVTASGIARGDSAIKIAGSVQKMLLQPKLLSLDAWRATNPGRGVYRSPYKNALRLAATESNRAFGAADSAFAKEKSWKLIWMVSTGPERRLDICDDYANESARNPYTPEEFASKHPAHPWCACYSTLVPQKRIEIPN